ncbi:YXWGXW repeat-containing protein [Variovorax paradoxus]|uniref:Uncharacterized protein n=1 Tax=Variovorax paradoxus (strain EPS) TaxID=595537 RepID=E6V4Y7_VARPE|nr:YXWGXW repeat-containing protein [Variovorax paradoxus]ADU38168.1 hypothetical protein Varpa_3996 [Variovorax paradoxus EPS]
MKIRFAALGLASAFALLAAPLGANAQVSVNINVPGLVMVAPPPPRYEAPPPPRGGYVWVPGRWAWDGRAYAWRRGDWRPARAGYAYAPGRWVEDRGGWRWTEGDWRRREARREARRDWGDGPRRHDRDDRGHGHGHRGHDRDRGDFCPPGQAKKGNC